MSSVTHKVEELRAKRRLGHYVYYLVKWADYPEKDMTWEPSKHIEDRQLIRDFEAQQAKGIVKWEYEVDSSTASDGKTPGWYPFDPKVSDVVEKAYQNWLSDIKAPAGVEFQSSRGKRTGGTSLYNYTLSFSPYLVQQNSKTNTLRSVRRLIH